jgi:hypothetical protein
MMRTLRSNSGPFVERPYFKDDEIEKMCADELRAMGLFPSSPEKIRIDRFIEKRFNVTPSYEELPQGVLGLTRFSHQGVSEVVVARELDEEGSMVAERRIRTTLAHEAGHCLLHTHLFVLATPSQNLFGDFTDTESPKVLCRGEVGQEARPGYDGKWWEFQANLAIGGLLIPAALMAPALEKFMLKSSVGFDHFDYERMEDAARVLAEVFDVNPAVARIRIKQVFRTDSRQQLLL